MSDAAGVGVAGTVGLTLTGRSGVSDRQLIRGEILTQNGTALLGTGASVDLLVIADGIRARLRQRLTLASLGPFYGAIAVPSVTRCRCRRRRRRRRGHRCAGGVRRDSSDTW